MSLTADFILASASPRRAELLQQIGARFRVSPAAVDESVMPTETPRDYVARMAVEKASAGWCSSDQKIPAMGADTAVVLGEQIFGKPTDKQHALAMLSALSGTTHSVLSAVAICDGDKTESRISETKVTFRHLKTYEMENYWRTGEPQDKAGAYGIQGLAAVFVERIEGSYSGVVGLPLAETCQLMEQFNLPWWQEYEF